MKTKEKNPFIRNKKPFIKIGLTLVLFIIFLSLIGFKSKVYSWQENPTPSPLILERCYYMDCVNCEDPSCFLEIQYIYLLTLIPLYLLVHLVWKISTQNLFKPIFS
jgi:hypothetical protein